jgi:hypothetical protein
MYNSILYASLWMQVEGFEQFEQGLPEFLQPLTQMARDNPLVAIAALGAVLFLTGLLPQRRRSRRNRTYGGRSMSYYLGRALGDVVRRGTRRR